MRALFVVASRELSSVVSERTVLLAVAIQLVVAGFSGFLVVGLSAMFDPASAPSAEIPVAVVGSTGLAETLRENGFDVGRFATVERAREAFRSGRVDAIVVEDDTKPSDSEPILVEIVVPDQEVRTTLIVVTLKQALEAYEAQVREVRADRLVAEPLRLDVGGSDHFAFVYTVLLPLLVLLPAFIGGAMVADALTEEYQRGTLQILLSAPVRFHEVLFGKLLANLVLSPLLAGLWILLLAANGIPVADAGWILLFVAGATALLGVAAACIAAVARERSRAQFLYSLAVLAAIPVSAFLPDPPFNLVARLAVGAADDSTWASLEATLVAAGLALVLLRLLAVATDPAKGRGAAEA
ncbi:MAG: ABC transporter permease [Methanobacteriota archaeon]